MSHLSVVDESSALRIHVTNFSELKKKEADRTQLIINNKHILKRQEYTINLLLKEREEVIKNLGMLLNNITDQKVLHFS